MLKRLMSLLDERTGWLTAAGEILDTPIVGGARLAYAFGMMLVALLGVELATGAALATVYAPSALTAWASVFHIEHGFVLGRLVRGVHFWAAQAMLIVTVTHLLQVVVFGAYKKPREVNWWVGLALLGLTAGFAHTGALLPWDQAAYWTSQVEAGIAGSMPAGAPVQRLIQGGGDLGTLTITRLYAAHVALLPVLTVLVLAVHLRLHRRHGITPPPGVPDADALPRDATDAQIAAAERRGLRVGRVWPDQIAMNAVLALALLVGLAYVAQKQGAPLDAPADPQGDYPARPEWYLLWLFKLRKYFPGKTEIIATVVIPGLGTAFLAALPLLDRRPSRALRGRLAIVAVTGLLFAGVGALTWVSLRTDAHDPVFRRARDLADRRAARARALAAQGVPPEGPLEMVRNDPQVRPGELFAAHCAGCHAEPGAPLRDAHGQRTNARAPTLAGLGSRDWTRALLVNPDADDLFGRTDIHEMPPQAERLGADGVAAVSEYMYAQTVEPGDPAANAALVERGSTIFHDRCTRCHQGAGDTSETDAADRDAPDLTRWGSRDWIRSQILHPEAPQNYGATRNHMPGFADELRGRDLEFVVDYVRGLRAQTSPRPQQPPPRPATPPADG